MNVKIEKVKIKGHTGTWYEIDRRMFYRQNFYLVESEVYGDEAACIIIDESHTPIIEDVFTGFDHDTVELLKKIAWKRLWLETVRKIN